MEILEEKAFLWLYNARFVKSKSGVYVLYDEKLNVLYIRENENLQKEFAKYVSRIEKFTDNRTFNYNFKNLKVEFGFTNNSSKILWYFAVGDRSNLWFIQR